MRAEPMTSKLHVLMLTLTVLLMSACASIDFDYPRAESHALTATNDTYLGKQLEGRAEQYPQGYAGFFPISDGIDALAARLLMAGRAERSIDAQYYLIKSDTVGLAFINSLLQAADRGVRVRLLVDDVFTKGYDAGMAGLDSHPNFEIRIFNPFRRGAAGRSLGAAAEFGRVNRRMHNKSFTVDNQITLIGGRNIADEYFGARKDARFGDLDVVGIGPVVNDISSMFDTYWNHSTATPVPAFAQMPEDATQALVDLRTRLAEARKEIVNTPYANAVKTQILKYVESDDDQFVWAPYTVTVDSPDKGIKKKSKSAASITTSLRESLLRAKQEMIVLSPYFVPRKSGVEAFSEIQKRGIQVNIITNSLAANNQFSVHAGYAPSRKPLLKSGVKIYEVRPDARVAGAEFIAASGATTTLHTKAFIVDRKELFIGSFNFDPRSAHINTELGVIIQSPELAGRVAAAVDQNLPTQTYEVFLNDKGKLRWKALEDGEDVIFDKEPKTTWGQRTNANLMRALPIRGQL
jgi:putative cardiolipin synthase